MNKLSSWLYFVIFIAITDGFTMTYAFRVHFSHISDTSSLPLPIACAPVHLFKIDFYLFLPNSEPLRIVRYGRLSGFNTTVVSRHQSRGAVGSKPFRDVRRKTENRFSNLKCCQLPYSRQHIRKTNNVLKESCFIIRVRLYQSKF